MITITDIASEFEAVVRHFNSIDSLSHASREISVQHGRDILEKLRVIAESEDSDKEKLDLDEIEWGFFTVRVSFMVMGGLGAETESLVGDMEVDMVV